MTANTPLATAGGKTEKRIPAPRLRPIKLDTLRHVRDELGRVYRDARQGRLPTGDATRLAFILSEVRKAIVDLDIEVRLTALEDMQNANH